MTLPSTVSRISYVTDGVTPSFPFPFKVWAASNVKVYAKNASTGAEGSPVLGIDYTIDIAVYPGAGNVVFVVPPPAGYVLTLEREMPFTQELDLIATGDFAAESVEAQLDKIVAEIQTLRDLVSRAPLFSVGSANYDLALPDLKAAVAGALLGADAAGTGFAWYSGVVPGSTPVTPFAATLLDDPSALAMLATLGLTNIFKGLAFSPIYQATVNVDFASVADNAVSAFVNVAVVGARPGDWIFARGDAGGTIHSTNGITLDARCINNDQVALTLINDSGSTFDAVAQNVNILGIPRPVAAPPF